ncbi:MAG: DUF192 domain-containing protein [Acidobacteriota bacterium]|nr:DUF192 domain-containing protein [Acidobacteriota bacterium]
MRRQQFKTWLSGIFLLCLFLGPELFCQSSHQVRYVKVFFPDGESVTAELAVSPAEREKGLMFRKDLSPDQGMLFVFEEEGEYSFWMKNTLISLDIIWLNASRQVVHLEENVPPCQADPCPGYSPDRKALYVLELKAGRAKELGLELYDQLAFVLPEQGKK